MIADADQLDAVAMVRLLRGEALPDQRDGVVLRVGAQRLVDRGRQAGRFMRRVVPGKIGGGERARAASIAAERAQPSRPDEDATPAATKQRPVTIGFQAGARPTVVAASQNVKARMKAAIAKPR